MEKFIIIHDKLLDYGGAEEVLLSIVKFHKPELIICSCISNTRKWEDIYKVPIVSPKLNSFIKSQFLFKYFYPYVILICSLSRLALPYKDYFFLVYSSSSGKYFRIKNPKKAIIYINYHAKGVLNSLDYLPKLSKIIFGWAISILFTLLYRIENLVLSRYRFIYTISSQSLESLPEFIKDNPKYNVGILHCPTIVSKCNTHVANISKFPNEYYVIISRLNHEKSIEPILDYINCNLDINIIIIGAGSLLDRFKKKYNSRFIFLGFVNSDIKSSIIAHCKAVIQPTSQEWSLVTVESNMIGIPVISSSSKGLEEINNTISGTSYFPNLLFKKYEDISKLILLLPSSKNYIQKNNKRIRFLFSQDLFFERLNFLKKRMALANTISK